MGFENKKTELRELMNGINQGQSLPMTWYTDPHILELEMAHIFHQSWQYLGRAEELEKEGDYITGNAGTIPALVVRGKDSLKAFVNICRHRRHTVLSDSGTRKMLQCPYHAWTYDLNGQLVSAPRCDKEEGFRKENLPLLPLKVEVWNRFVFVHPDLNAPPLSRLLEGLSDTISRSGMNLSDLRFKQRVPWESSSNWKIMMENYLECYHCPIQHPSFSKLINVDPATYSLKSTDYFFTQTAPTRKPNIPAEGRLAGEILTEAQYIYIWPNITININPGPANLSIDVWLPNGTSQSHGFTDIFFGKKVTKEEAQEMTEFNDQVGAEDDSLTNAIQKSVQSGMPISGRLSSHSEHLITKFSRLIAEAVLADY